MPRGRRQGSQGLVLDLHYPESDDAAIHLAHQMPGLAVP